MSNDPQAPAATGAAAGEISLYDLGAAIGRRWKGVLAASLLVGCAALAATYAVAPRFTGRTLFLPPQQQQSASASALASLGALAGLVGGGAGVRLPAEQYISFMQSETVKDRLIERFGLMQVYKLELRGDARERLSSMTRISAGKKDGLVTVEVDDVDPKRAAALANQYVEELRRLTSDLAVTEAQQRRAFFEAQLKRTRDDLTRAQQALEASGFSAGALRSEPRAAAEQYARVKAEVRAAEVLLQTLRSRLVDNTPEVQQAQARLAALRAQQVDLERSGDSGTGPDYVSRFREFKYHETLFELFSRQYESARLDESREGALLQVVDPAQVPERKSWPRRGLTAVTATLATMTLLVLAIIVQQAWRHVRRQRTALPAPRPSPEG